MRNKFLKKTLKAFLAIAFWTLVWEAASFLISDNLKLFLPAPHLVVAALARLCATFEFWQSVLFTLLRIFTGFAFGVIGGILTGTLTAHIKVFDCLLSPAMRVIRAVPVVSFIILAFLFIKVNFLPVFICFLMVMPLVWQTVHDELTRFDRNLTEMSEVFKIKGLRKLFYVKFATISDKVLTATVNGIGLAWKSGVATEVICSPGIALGYTLSRAKGNINYDDVYAITLAVVLLSIIIELIIKYFYNKTKRLEKQYD